MKDSTEVWTFHSDLDTDTRSWVGYDVEGPDGHVGKIDEVSTEAGRGSLVVDTGFWIFGKKRLLPAAGVRSVDHDKQQVLVSLTKEQIKDAPDYDEARAQDVSTNEARGEEPRVERSYYEDHALYYGVHL